MEDFEGDLSKNLDIVRDINLKLGNDNFKLNDIGEYIENLNTENKKIKNEVIEILLICEETPKNDILDNLIFLKRKLHYNFSLFNILYIFCYTIFYFYIFYNFNYNNIYIYILFLLIIVYTFI